MLPHARARVPSLASVVLICGLFALGTAADTDDDDGKHCFGRLAVNASVQTFADRSVPGVPYASILDCSSPMGAPAGKKVRPRSLLFDTEHYSGSGGADEPTTMPPSPYQLDDNVTVDDSASAPAPLLGISDGKSQTQRWQQKQEQQQQQQQTQTQQHHQQQQEQQLVQTKAQAQTQIHTQQATQQRQQKQQQTQQAQQAQDRKSVV